MYECDMVGCAEFVSHPGQLCLACRQRWEAEDDTDEEVYDDEEGYL